MTRVPQHTPTHVVAALKRAGFDENRQKGSHLYLVHPQTKRRTSVAIHPRDLPRHTLKDIIRQAGLTEEEFRKLL